MDPRRGCSVDSARLHNVASWSAVDSVDLAEAEFFDRLITQGTASATDLSPHNPTAACRGSVRWKHPSAPLIPAGRAVHLRVVR